MERAPGGGPERAGEEVGVGVGVGVAADGRRRVAWLALGLVLWLGAQAGAARAEEPVPAVNADDGLALEGYDPVAYFTRGEPAEGRPDLVAEHGGARYRFATPEHRERFLAEPERYLPAYGGFCAYAMSVDSIADIDPDRWSIVDGRLYLNAGRLASGLWALGTKGNIERADRNWSRREKRPLAP